MFHRLFPWARKHSAPDEAPAAEVAFEAAQASADLWQTSVETRGEAMLQTGLELVPAVEAIVLSTPLEASPEVVEPALANSGPELPREAEPAHIAEPVHVADNTSEPVVPASPPPTKPARALRLRQDVVFGQDGNDAALLGSGWSGAEPRHRWTAGQDSEIALDHPGDGDALLVFDIGGFIRAPAVPLQRLFVQVNDVPVGSLVVQDNRRLGLRIPEHALAGADSMRLRFSHPDAAAPAEFGMVNDKRCLGICFRRLRVFSLPDTVPARIEGTGGLGRKEAEQRTGEKLEQLLARFESLGETVEFGMVQRRAGIERQGLLRFAVMTLPRLIAGIESGFEGIGDAARLSHAALPGADGRVFEIRDQTAGLSYKTASVEEGLDDETMVLQQARRLKLLRLQMLDDMVAGEKMFVFRRHPGKGEPTEAEMLPLLQALHQHGPCTLLFITAATADNPLGTVSRIAPWLLRGYLDAAIPGTEATRMFGVWAELCANAFIISAGREV